MTPSMRALLVALLGCPAAALSAAKPKRAAHARTKTLLATMVYPEDETPVDLMMEHHLRMVSSDKSILQGAIIDNRPPWGPSNSNQEPLLARYKRSQDSTGVVKVKKVDYNNMTTLATRFFSSGDGELNLRAMTPMLRISNQLTTLAAHTHLDVPTNVSKLGEKDKAARLLGMLNFLELCADADADVDLCVYIEPTTFVHRTNETGIVEQAVKLFRQNPQAVVLLPPDMCISTKTTENGVCKAGNVTGGGINHGFFVVNRDRFEGFAPMPVESVGLDSVFEDLLAEGLTKGGVEGPVKQIRCGGGAFVIHPYDDSLGKYACHTTKQLGLSAHTQALMSRQSSARVSGGIFAEDYVRFPGGGARAAALASLIERFEAGRFPEAKYLESLTNKCTNMCPSKERIRDGLAW